MGLIGGNTILNFLSNTIPKSMCTIRKLINMKQAIKEYVVCPKCDRLYDLSDCIIVENGQEQSKLCEFIKFPRHRQTSHRSKCNTTPMKSVIVEGKKKLVPRKSFFYHSVIHGLESLLATKFFLQKYWKTHTVAAGTYYADIYDGAVWKHFNEMDSVHNLNLMMNVDWFNPYEETQYSVGAVYLVIQNLPRYERFKLTNIVLVGLIPGPKEPSKIINTYYLEPLINDLIKLYQGVEIPNLIAFLVKPRSMQFSVV